MVIPSGDTVLQEEPRSPAPPKTEENPIPLPDAISEKQVASPPPPMSFLDDDALWVEPESPPIENSQEAFKEKLLRQARVFWSQWDSSEGFDVDEEPLDLVCGPRIFNESDMKQMHIKSDDSCMQCVDFAIDRENDLKKSNLEFVQLVKFNVDFESQGKIYYLTFKAKDGKDGENVYQAKVFNPEKCYVCGDDDDKDEEDEEYEKDAEGKLKRTLLIFRKKPSKRPQWQALMEDHGFFKKRCCPGKKEEERRGCSCDGDSS